MPSTSCTSSTPSFSDSSECPVCFEVSDEKEHQFIALHADTQNSPSVAAATEASANEFSVFPQAGYEELGEQAGALLRIGICQLQPALRSALNEASGRPVLSSALRNQFRRCVLQIEKLLSSEAMQNFQARCESVAEHTTTNLIGCTEALTEIQGFFAQASNEDSGLAGLSLHENCLRRENVMSYFDSSFLQPIRDILDITRSQNIVEKL